SPPPVLTVGSTVTWSYLVTNTGNIALTNVTVVDDNGTPGNLMEHFTPRPVSRALGASTALTHTGTVLAGSYTNNATASGTDSIADPATASDSSGYFGASPPLTVVTSPTRRSSDLSPPPVLTVGSTVTWSYLVTNTGNVALTNVTVVDDNGTP